MSLREVMAAGPQWLIQRDDDGVPPGAPAIVNCVSCGDLGYVDGETGLCRACWRVWRFVALLHAELHT